MIEMVVAPRRALDIIESVLAKPGKVGCTTQSVDLSTSDILEAVETTNLSTTRGPRLLPPEKQFILSVIERVCSESVDSFDPVDCAFDLRNDLASEGILHFFICALCRIEHQIRLQSTNFETQRSLLQALLLVASITRVLIESQPLTEQSQISNGVCVCMWTILNQIDEHKLGSNDKYAVECVQLRKAVTRVAMHTMAILLYARQKTKPDVEGNVCAFNPFAPIRHSSRHAATYACQVWTSWCVVGYRLWHSFDCRIISNHILRAFH
eukprot:c8110_g1_i2.p1 GENE.c8110_g1_i2~~c8110_g1_i2.p1  ORF type:complete len:267 (+),score=43.70 c8110_g1_i2:90-890(+)